MLDEIKRFDMAKKPIRQRLGLIIWITSLFSLLSHKGKIKKVNMKGIKPPYILLCNHNAFLDFKIASLATFPHKTNYVVALDGFIKREKLLRRVGGICKRKFTNDAYLVRQIKTVIDNKDIIIIYPEARYSLCGTNSTLLESTGKLVKLLKVPLVTLICHGHHINHPFWNTSKERHVKHIEAKMTCLIKKEDIEKYSAEEITKLINDEFKYDDFAWQKENKIKVKTKDRAKYLEKVLYQCPHCKKEYEMKSEGNKLWCDNCKYVWEMNEYGELISQNNFDQKFSHIPYWYEWERANVRKEVEEGKYSYDLEVEVESLPNSDGFINIGNGRLVHNLNGFVLEGNYKGENYKYEWNSKTQYAVHVEYNYLFKHGDLVDLNTLTDTFYIYPKGTNFSVTKMSLATEEIYKYLNKKD